MKEIALEQLAFVERGRFMARPRTNPIFYGGNIPFIQTGDVAKSGGIVQSYSQTLNKKGLEVSKMFPRGTLVISIAANIGDVAEVNFDFACPDSLIAVRAKAGVSQKWLKYLLTSKKGYFESRATQNAQPNINLETVKPLKILVPCLAEQERIAEILSGADSVIAAAEKKLNLVIARNKRLMLEFATSESAGWETKRLSEIVLIKKGEQLNRDVFLRDGNYPVYNGGVTHSGYYDRWNTEANTLTISEGGNAGYVRYVAERFWSGGHCYTLEAKDKKIDTKLVYFLLKAKEQEIMRLKVGSALKNIQAKDLSAFKIQLPPSKMGAKISEALSAAEQEREKILSLIAALKKQKRGLMQQLLTGRSRVKTNRLG